MAKKKTAGQRPSITHADLIEVLLDLPPIELKGVELLRQFRTTGIMPTDREQVTLATQQLIRYTAACERTGDSLKTLPPVPAHEADLVEGFPL